MSIRGNPIGWPLHEHDDRYLKNYGMNGCNIDSTDGNWTAYISENGYGTVPETEIAVTQLGDGILFQIALKCENNTSTYRKGNKVWIRNKNLNGVWSAWAQIASLYSGSRGSSEFLALPAGTITQIVLDSWTAGMDNNGFTFSDGGVKMPLDGTVLISGSVYMHNGSKTEVYRGVYVYKDTTEITSVWGVDKPVGAVGAPPVIVSVKAGDVIYLKARCSAEASCAPGEKSTHLDILYI